MPEKHKDRGVRLCHFLCRALRLNWDPKNLKNSKAQLNLFWGLQGFRLGFTAAASSSRQNLNLKEATAVCSSSAVTSLSSLALFVFS